MVSQCAGEQFSDLPGRAGPGIDAGLGEIDQLMRRELLDVVQLKTEDLIEALQMTVVVRAEVSVQADPVDVLRSGVPLLGGRRDLGRRDLLVLVGGIPGPDHIRRALLSEDCMNAPPRLDERGGRVPVLAPAIPPAIHFVTERNGYATLEASDLIRIILDVLIISTRGDFLYYLWFKFSWVKLDERECIKLDCLQCSSTVELTGKRVVYLQDRQRRRSDVVVCRHGA